MPARLIFLLALIGGPSSVLAQELVIVPDTTAACFDDPQVDRPELVTIEFDPVQVNSNPGLIMISGRVTMVTPSAEDSLRYESLRFVGPTHAPVVRAVAYYTYPGTGCQLNPPARTDRDDPTPYYRDGPPSALSSTFALPGGVLRLALPIDPEAATEWAPQLVISIGPQFHTVQRFRVAPAPAGQ